MSLVQARRQSRTMAFWGRCIRQHRHGDISNACEFAGAASDVACRPDRFAGTSFDFLPRSRWWSAWQGWGTRL